MTLIRYEPWSVLNQLHGQINRLFDAEIDRDASTSAATADWIPQADIEEYTDRFVLKLDVPGVELEAVEITLDNGLLTLSGERAKEPPARTCSARASSACTAASIAASRCLDTVDAAGVCATGRNGIVEVTIPEAAEKHSRAASRSRLPDAVDIGDEHGPDGGAVRPVFVYDAPPSPRGFTESE